ncbi:MAG: hypothetical protein IJ007_05070 [Oscillospiraceae bacterium]|nr:hypothetical protein [Oscillospiraceae bacterium]
MKKSLIILLSILTLTACTTQTKEITTETSVAASATVTTAEIITESTSAAEKITSTDNLNGTDTSCVPENFNNEGKFDIVSEMRDITSYKEIFTELVYAELENNRTAQEDVHFKPVGLENISVIDAMESDMFLLDANSDGAPELFTGTHGTAGTGCYTVYSADEGIYGNSCFTWLIDEFRIVDGEMYAPSGNNWYWGWTKLCKGLSSVHVQLVYPDAGAYDVDIRLSDGTEKKLTSVPEAEINELFQEYLGISAKELENSSSESPSYVRACLSVPDPENYTKEDIYNCIAELLAEYAGK